ncbi:MAG: TonB-dependent receptor domain-containing protein [Balneola sp.]
MNTFKKGLFLLIALLCSSQILAQEGKIVGTVVDAETGETLIGVNVVIEGTIQGTATDIDGNYTIRRVAAGTYNIKVSYLSYSTQIITGVVVGEGEVVRLDVAMQAESEFLDEIVVTAEAVLNNEAGLLRQRQKSVAFSDVISSETISKSGAGDAAGVLKKVVGASVVGGKYVYVRGLGERYSSTHMNGIELPTADPDKKAFQLDLIPSSLIENVVTLKTFTPDKPGNFSGGLVDVTTKDFPEQRTLEISVSSAYNSQIAFQDGLLGERSGTDWLGFDDGQRDIPSYLQDLRDTGTPIPGLSSGDNIGSQESVILNNASRAFNNEMVPVSTSLPLDYSFGLSFGDQAESKIGKIGYSISLTYSRSIDNYENGSIGRYLLVGETATTEELTAERLYSDYRTDDNVDWGSLVNLAYIPHSNHKFNFSYFRTQSGTHQGRLITGFWDEAPEANQISNVLSYQERSLQAMFLTGKSVFDKFNNVEVEWKLSQTNNAMATPDLRYFLLQSEDSQISGSDTTLYSNPSSLYPRPSRFFRDLNESGNAAILDVSIPVLKNSKFKTGLFYDSKERDFNESRYDIFDDAFGIRDAEGDIFEFFGTQGIIDSTVSGRGQGYDYGTYVEDGSEVRNSYTSESNISAYYGMIDLFVTDQLRLIGGARVEYTDITATSDDSVLATTPNQITLDNPTGEGFQGVGRLDNMDVLPSLSLVYSLNESMNFRAAYTKTLARPTVRELMPLITFDFAGDFLFQGNPRLERTLITNYDFRFEWFPAPGEILAFSAFYKDLEKPMERVIRNDIGNNATSIQNVPKGRVQGVEFELRKRLGFLTESLDNFTFAGNLTFVHSEVDIADIELDFIRAANPNASSTRQLFGQSPYIVNIDLQYQNDKGLSTNLSFNRFGDRLSLATGNATPNVFERAYNTLNWNLNYQLTNNLSLGAKIDNILNPDIVQSYEFKGQEYIFQSFKRGMSFSTSLKYSL